ncbi:flavin-containing monooxygenase [Mycolicibacterium sp.]|uniref:flavin-containing monooxygenase n=1 Tax=Mycolicibacterium sp. TaxID=2320850 RepID=UPI003D0F4B05
MAQQSIEVLVVGAGFSGLYALIRMRELGFDAVAADAGGDVGGTWYWNRYPGARVDTESVDYSFSFSAELQQEWTWTERYAAQPEILAYLRHVATRFALWPHIHLNTRIEALRYDDARERWDVTSTDGRRWSAKYCILATGFLSAPLRPRFEGLQDYRGTVLRSTEWPTEDVDFAGRSVGIVGTGSTGVQMFPIIARKAGRTYLFQRTPCFTVPLRNVPLEPEFQAAVKADYANWRARQRRSSIGANAVGSAAAPEPIAESATAVTDAERLAVYDECWERGGINGYYLSFADLGSNQASNDTLADYIKGKIRERVGDPELAERLTPDYPIMAKRLCADTDYYESFALDTVTLVDVAGRELRFTPTGVVVGGERFDLDIVVFATGFDAVTGAVTRIDICGRGGRKLNEHWAEAVRTTAGIMATGFPNLFWLNGPGSPAADANPPLMAEDQMQVIGNLIVSAEAAGRSVEGTPEMDDEWLALCDALFAESLLPKAKSWYNGGNVESKSSRGMLYLGGPVTYLELLQEHEKKLLAIISEEESRECSA